MSLGIILLAQTLIIALITGLININFWYSYILFLIIIGGILVLFIYITRVASNEKFKWNFRFFPFFIISGIILISLLIFDYFFNQLLNTINNFYLFNTNQLLSLNKYISFPNIILILLVILYLLITLIAVVKITNLKHGPLRQKF